MHSNLPTNHFRRSHHMTNDSSCHICGTNCETLLHILRDCIQAKKSWDSFSFNQDLNFNIGSHSDWFKQHALDDQGELFVIICWFIWRAHNEVIFSDKKWDDWHILNNINVLFNSVIKAVGSSASKKQPKLVFWLAPSDNIVKVNVDGNSLGNPGRSGYGGIICNSDGEWLVGFSGFCGIITNLNAELLTTDHGLKLAWFSGYREVVCESDSKTALTLIEEGVQRAHPYAPVVNYIRGFRDSVWTLSFHQTIREGNACVDWLPKHGAKMLIRTLRFGHLALHNCLA